MMSTNWLCKKIKLSIQTFALFTLKDLWFYS